MRWLKSCFYPQYFPKHSIDGEILRKRLETHNVTIPLGMLDGKYLFTTETGWNTILPDLTFKAGLPGDCDNYAFRAYVKAADMFKVQGEGVACAIALGWTPGGYHSFNMIYTGQGFKLFEPNRGFGIKGLFAPSENGYMPDRVVL